MQKETEKVLSTVLFFTLAVEILAVPVRIASAVDPNSVQLVQDYGAEVSLLSDYEEYERKVEQLKAEDNLQEINKLSVEKHKLWDENMLDRQNVSADARFRIAEFRDKFSGMQETEEYDKALAALNTDLENIDREINSPEKSSGVVADVPAVKMNGKDFEMADLRHRIFIEKADAKTVVPVVTNPPVYSIEREKLIRLPEKINDVRFYQLKKYNGDKTEDSVRKKTAYSFPGLKIANAEDPAMPIINYYEGIEDNDIEHMLYYLSRNQNDDGSYGTFNRYDLSGQIALSLSRFNMTDNDQYLLLLDYLKNAVPVNNREKAIKARLMFGLGESYEDLITDLIAQKNSDGGYGLDRYYQSDPQTTLEVIWALWVTNTGYDHQLPQAINYVLGQISPEGIMKYTENDVSSYYLINKTVEYLFPFRDLSVGGGVDNVAISDKTDALLGYLLSQYDIDSVSMVDAAINDDMMFAYGLKLFGAEDEIFTALRHRISESRWFDGSYGDSMYGLVAGLKLLTRPDLEITDITSSGVTVNGSELQLNLTIKNHGYEISGDADLHFIADNFHLAQNMLSGVDALEIPPQGQVMLTYNFSGTSSLIGATDLKFYIEQDNESDYRNNWKSQSFFFEPAADGNSPMPMDYSAVHFPIEPVQGQPVRGIAFSWKQDKSAYEGTDVVALFRPSGTSSWYVWHISNGGVFLYNLPENEFPEGVVVDATVGVYKNGTYRYLPITQVQLSTDRNQFLGTVSGNISAYGEGCDKCAVSTGFDSVVAGSDGFFENTVPNGRVYLRGRDQNEAIYKSYNVLPGAITPDTEVITHLRADEVPPEITQLKIEEEEDMVIDNNHEARIYVKTNENVALKEVDFYYLDPVEQYWRYLGSSFKNVNEQTFSWYVNSGLIGNGYKIKAVARDFQNNESAIVEWGPFQITDTTDYTPPVINEFYVIGESDYQLYSDREFSLVINAEDNGDVTFCEVYYFDPVAGEWNFINSRNCDGYGDILIWNIPADLHGNGFRLKAIVYDAFSNPSEAREWGPFEIVDSYPPDNEIPIIEFMELRYGNGSGNFKNQTTYNILVDGEDNEAYGEGDIYYWDINTGEWELIGTFAAMNTTQIYAPWTIPASLFGSGYKLKAVVRDPSGNASLPMEWGPFNVIDGTLPTGTVTVQGLDEGKWGIGQEKTINWTINTSTPLLGISSIRFRYGSSSTQIASNYDITQNSFTYTIPVNSYYTTDSAYIEMDVYDSNYNHGIIKSENFQVVDATPIPQEPWSVPESYDLVLSATKVDRSVKQVFHNADGSTELLYNEWLGYSFESAGQTRRLVYQKLVDDVWQDPVIIHDYWYRNGVTNDQWLEGIDCVKGADGSLHIIFRVFEDEAEEWAENQNNAELWYAHLVGNSLVKTMQLPTGISADVQRISVSPTNRVSMVWKEGYDWVTGTGERSLMFIEGDGLNSWNVPEALVSGSISNIGMDVDAQGAMIVYTSRGQMRFILEKNDDWIMPESLIQTTIPRGDLDLYTEDSAKMYLIVEEDSNPDQYRWLPSITSYEILENILTVNSFINKQNILNAWYRNDYGANASGLKLFRAGADEYDLFYLNGNEASSYRYNVHYMKLGIDGVPGAELIDKKLLVNRSGSEDVRSFRVGVNDSGNYHVFYVMREGDFNRLYYMFFDGEGTYFNNAVSRMSMSVDDIIVAAAFDDNSLYAWFNSYQSGRNGLFSNHADFSSLIDYRLSYLSPDYMAEVSGNAAVLYWQIEGGADNFDVLTGSSLYSMSYAGQGLTESSYMVSGLEAGKTYYWRVVAHRDGKNIVGSIWKFATLVPENDCVPPLTGDWVISESCPVTENLVAPGDLIVKDNAVLTIENNASINVDFNNHAVRVIPWSGILIKPGGKLY